MRNIYFNQPMYVIRAIYLAERVKYNIEIKGKTFEIYYRFPTYPEFLLKYTWHKLIRFIRRKMARFFKTEKNLKSLYYVFHQNSVEYSCYTFLVENTDIKTLRRAENDMGYTIEIL